MHPLSRPARISLGYIAVAAAWILASDSLIALFADDPADLIRMQAWKGTAFVLVTGLALYALVRRAIPPGAAKQAMPAPRERYLTVLLGLTFGLLALLISGAGVLAYRHQTDQFKKHQVEKQAAIAELKAVQIEGWFSWHRQDAELMGRDLDMADAVPLLEGPRSEQQAGRLRAHFEGLLASGRWAGIGLYAADGRPLVLAGRTHALDPAHQALVAATATSGVFHLNDMHAVDEDGSEFRIDFLVPVPAGPDARGDRAVLVLSTDPEDSLFRTALSWPVPSDTSEALLVRREGEEVVLMTTPRHGDSKPLALRKPLTEANLAIAQAVLRNEGIHEGFDYRVTPVLAAFRPVRGTPWHIVAKTDTQEVILPLQQQSRLILSVVLLAIGITAIFVAYLWRSRQAAFAAQSLQGKAELEAMAQKFHGLFHHAPDCILLLDPDGRVVDANRAALDAYGYDAAEMHRLSARDLLAPEALADFDADFKAANRAEGYQFETLHRRKDGSTFPVEVRSCAIALGSQSYRQSFVRDISARRRDEEKNRQQLKELQQWYKVTLEREERVLQLKAEIDSLLQRLNEPPRYSARKPNE